MPQNVVIGGRVDEKNGAIFHCHFRTATPESHVAQCRLPVLLHSPLDCDNILNNSTHTGHITRANRYVLLTNASEVVGRALSSPFGEELQSGPTLCLCGAFDRTEPTLLYTRIEGAWCIVQGTWWINSVPPSFRSIVLGLGMWRLFRIIGQVGLCKQILRPPSPPPPSAQATPCPPPPYKLSPCPSYSRRTDHNPGLTLP